MDILLGSTVVQIAGVVIVTAALLQAAVMFYASWQRLGHEKTHRELSLELLRRRVEGETAQRQFERDRETAVWSGMRKFPTKAAASAPFTWCRMTESRCRRSTRVSI